MSTPWPIGIAPLMTRDAAVRLDPHRAALPAGRGVLDERREPDADKLASGPPPRPHGQEVVVATHPHQRVEQARVIAAVVAGAVRRPVREVGRLEEVAPPDLDRIDLELARGGVDQPLDDVGGLRPAGPSVRAGRRGGREDGRRLGLVGGDAVGAGRELGHPKRLPAAPPEQVRPEVRDGPGPQAEDAPLAIDGRVGLVDLVARVLGGEEVLLPGRDPDRSADRASRASAATATSSR